MTNHIRSFLWGVVCAVFLLVGGFFAWDTYFDGPGQSPILTTNSIPPGTVIIEPLPTYRTFNGINVSFKGKADFQQVIAGRYAQDIRIISFRATGENAEKSSISIVWEDGTTEIVPAGVSERNLGAKKRAKQIIIRGYSMHERKVFQDSAKSGTLNWEIHYQPIEN
jgi:hypothetical protein